MRKVMIVGLAVLTIGIGAVVSAWAEDDTEGLDPLLKLLVKRGVITLEEARAVQEEVSSAAPKTGAFPTGKNERGKGSLETPVPEPPEADPAAPPVQQASKEKKEKWYDRIELRGDIRLRYEGFLQEGLDENDRRDRFRLRIRPSIYATVTDWMEVGFQLRTGDPKDPVSDNQSVDGGFSMKAIAISEGFAAFDATDWLDLTLGKFDAKKKWVVSDMQWDDDVTIEGFMQEVGFGVFEANVYQLVLEEQKKGDDAYILGGQLLANFGSDSAGKFTVGVGYDNWNEPQLLVDLTLDDELRGNKVTNLLGANDQLISEFRIFNAYAKWTYSRNPRWPVKVSVYGYKNTGARDLGEQYDTGYFARVQVGDYKEPGQLMFRYSRYYSEPDAIFYVFAQSDTTRASDVDGHRFDIRIGYVKRSYFNLTWYHTDAVYADVPTMDRWQVDYIIRF